MSDELAGRVCMITGASSGIGKVAALELAHRGAHLVLVCRNADKGEAVRDETRAATGNDQIDLMLADLSAQDRDRDEQRPARPRRHAAGSPGGAHS